MKKKIQTFIASFVFITLIVGVCFVLFSSKRSKEFKIDQIVSEVDDESSVWNVSQTAEEKELIHHILDQPFFYLEKGQQSVAFCNQEHTYVLKFLKGKRMNTDPWLKLVSSLPMFKGLYAKEVERKKSRKYRLFSSYKLAYDELKDETGLIYLHLNKTKGLHSNIRLIDQKGRSHILNLDDCHFCIQRYAMPCFDRLKEEMEKGNVEKAKQLVNQIITLVINRHQKGIFDGDPCFEHNSGFIDDRAIIIDLGRFSKVDDLFSPKFSKNVVFEAVTDLHEWLQEYYPYLDQYLNDQLALL